MATRALTHPSINTSHGAMRVTEIYSDQLSAISVHDPVAAAKADSTCVSRASALGCAKGAMVAIGVEAVAGVVAVCVYELFRHAIL